MVRPDPPAGRAGTGRLVLHLLPTDRPRGAQALARVIIDQLDGRPDRHEALTLFTAAREGLLRPEHCLGLPQPTWRVAGVDPRAAWRLRRRVRQLHPAAVVSHGGEMLPYLPLAVPRSVPAIYYRVGTANEHLRSPWRRRAYRWLVGRCRLVVAISDEAAEEARALYGATWADVPIIPNGRDPEVFHPVDRTDRAGQDVVALYVGEISAGKGADRFVRAIAALRSAGLAVRGVMAGAGPLVPELAAAAGEAATELVGHVSDVPGLMAEADLFVFPSIDREGMPGVLVEAALCGLPSVASGVPGVPAVVVDRETGFIVDPSDAAALEDRVAQLVRDADLRASMGTAARSRAVARFSEAAVGDRWRELFVSLLGPPR